MSSSYCGELAMTRRRRRGVHRAHVRDGSHVPPSTVFSKKLRLRLTSDYSKRVFAEPSVADSRFFRVDYGDVAEVAAIARTEILAAR
jgi:hypothetical protein